MITHGVAAPRQSHVAGRGWTCYSREMERNGSTVQIITLLLSLVAALAGVWNGWQIATLTGQVQALQELLITHVTTPGVHSD